MCLFFFNTSKPVLTENVCVDWPIRNSFSQQKSKHQKTDSWYLVTEIFGDPRNFGGSDPTNMLVHVIIRTPQFSSKISWSLPRYLFKLPQCNASPFYLLMRLYQAWRIVRCNEKSVKLEHFYFCPIFASSALCLLDPLTLRSFGAILIQ